MKTYRPRSSGFIVIYVIAFLSLLDVGYTLYTTITGANTGMMGSFSYFAYMIAAVAWCYTWMYGSSRVELREETLHMVYPAMVSAPEKGPRAMILFRQGDLDMRRIDKTFRYDQVVRWGYQQDLKVSRLDKSQAHAKSPLLPVHEVAFLTADGKRYHLNVGLFTKKQRAELLPAIAERMPLPPEGDLKDELAKA